MSKPHILSVRVYYEDTDFSGFVYHASYLRYAERGRSEFLRALGITHKILLEGTPPVVLVVRQMEIDFLRPAYVDDLLEVQTRCVSFLGARLQMEQKIYRGEEALWRAGVTVAVVNTKTQAPHRVPENLAKRLKKALN